MSVGCDTGVSKFPEDSKTRGDCTYEESVERQPDDVGAKRDHHQPDLEVLHCHDQAAGDPLVLRIGVGLTHVLNHAQLCDLALLLGEATGVVGQVWEDEDGGNGNGLGPESAKHEKRSWT